MSAKAALTLPMAGVIERRLLINYRLDPGVARSVLPSGLRPQLVDGSAVAGVSMIRLRALRPTWAPSGLGLRMENAAHRIAVEWDAAHGRVHPDAAFGIAGGGRHGRPRVPRHPPSCAFQRA